MSPPAVEEQIPVFDLRLSGEHVAAVEATLRAGWLTMGPKTAVFERAFAEQLGARHAVALSSCTAALHLAYLAAGIGPGDEVIVPAITFVATAAAVRYCGATPVIVDVIGPHDPGIDPDEVRARITPRTKAVCVVHYAGYAAAVEEVRAICEQRGLALIEDAAHAPSAYAEGDSGRKLGTWGLASVFSFMSNKVLSCGEGGLLATDDAQVAAQVRRSRSHGMTSETWERHRGHATGYDVLGLGFNYRLDEVRAALLLARLGGMEADIARRRELVLRYRALLAGTEGVVLPYRDADVERSSCYLMPALVDPQLRDAIRESMLARGVHTTVLYPAIHEFTAYVGAASRRLPRAELIARSQLSLPLYPHLTEAQQDRVVDALLSAIAELA